MRSTANVMSFSNNWYGAMSSDQQIHQDFYPSSQSSLPDPQYTLRLNHQQQFQQQQQQQQNPSFHSSHQRSQMYPDQYQSSGLASSSSPSSSPLQNNNQTQGHSIQNEFQAHFPTFNAAAGSAFVSVGEGSFNRNANDYQSAYTMGAHQMNRPVEEMSSAFSPPFQQQSNFAPLPNQIQSSTFGWIPSEPAHSGPGANLDCYGTAPPRTTMSEASFASESSGAATHSSQIYDQHYHMGSSMQQHQQQQQQNTQLDMSRNHLNDPGQLEEMSLIKKQPPSRLDLQTSSHPMAGTQWNGGVSMTTPSSSSSFKQEEQSHHHLMSSPSWLSQYHDHSQVYTGLPHTYQQEAISLAPTIQSSIMSGLQSDNFSEQSLGGEASQPYVHYPIALDQHRPTSRASGVSLVGSSSTGSFPLAVQRSDNRNESYPGSSEASYIGQLSLGSSNSHNAPSWLKPSPSASDHSSGQLQQQQQQQTHHIRQGSHQRKISTPQRLQQKKDSTMYSKQASQQSSPSRAGSHVTSSAGDMDYTDHRLSAALANDAQISSSNPSDLSSTSSRHQRGNTTPTIMEEDQSGLIQSPMSQDHTQSTPSLSIHQPYQQQQQGLLSPPSSSVVRRHRPTIRPNIFQQYNSFNLIDEPAQGLQDCSPFIDEVLGNYLSSPSRLGLGEKSVLIMTSKVAQKSYGSEKRFLCPPPMVLLIGSSWWSSQEGSRAANDARPTVLTPPRLTISMGEESNMQEAPLEWASPNGRLIDVGNSSSEMAISGRSIGRQLFINDADDKKRHCEALVHITVPGLSSSDRRSLGTFASKPIKVISKPSKKRQSTRTSDLSVNHGSTISLFHRLRSQTVSTRYLCVSGAPNWFKGSDGEPFLNTNSKTHIPNQGEPSSCFVAKMSSWDPFIIYLVDPLADSTNLSVSNDNKKGAFNPGFPPPPVNILPRPVNGVGQPICYNQAVVLQCLNTAVVSPVMIIRKVDRATTVVGGGQNSFTSRMEPYVETVGDPVSQLHKIAFEILEDSKAPVPTAESRDSGAIPGQSGHFLGCLNEDVGLRKPVGFRQWVPPHFSGPPTPTTPITPMHSGSGSSRTMMPDSMETPPKAMSDAITAATMAAAAHTRYSLSQRREGAFSPSGSFVTGSSSAASQYSSSSISPIIPPDMSTFGISSDEEGSLQKRPRRVSSSIVIQKDRFGGAAAKNRRRGQSLSILGMQQQQQAQHHHHQQQQQQWPLSAQQQQVSMQPQYPGASSADSRLHLRRTSSFANSLSNSEASSSFGIPSGALWTVDVHDSDVWTIVGTDIAQHTFYIPTKLVGGVRSSSNIIDPGIAHLINVPAPATPITPLPIVSTVVGPGSHPPTLASNKSANSDNNLVTITGENLTSDLFVYFGPTKSARVTNENNTVLYCEPPSTYEESGFPRGRVPIILIRRDGVIFPTPHIYQC